MPPANPTTTFTAAELAPRLGVSPRAVRDRLNKVPPDEYVRVKGQRTPAWRPESWPASLFQEIHEGRARSGCATIAEYLRPSRGTWTSPKPWGQIPEPFRERALKLCEALAPILATQHEPNVMDRAAVAYRQTFGNEIDRDKLRYVMDRATERDSRLMQFGRPALYLDDAAFADQPKAPLALAGLHAPLDDYVAQVNKTDPTLDDRMHIFHHAFKHLETLTDLHPSKGERRAIKSSLVQYLQANVPGLYRPHADGAGAATGKPLLALRRLFNLNYAAWTASGRDPESLADGRAGNSGKEGYRCEPCDKMIHDQAAHFRGIGGKKGAPRRARRALYYAGKLCPNCAERAACDLEERGNSYMAAAQLKRVTPNRLTIAKTKGPRAVQQVAPTMQRDWSAELPGDWLNIDDETPNHLSHAEFYDENPGGETPFIHGRVQNLLVADVVSWNPIDFLLYIGAPNGRRIRQILKKILVSPKRGGIGLPRKGIILERGVFKCRMVAGDSSPHALEFREVEAMFDSPKVSIEFSGCPKIERPNIERERGLSDRTGLHLHHATTPQAKPIERQFREFQERLAFVPHGRTGFDERRESSQAMQDFKRRVDAGKEHPGNEWLSLKDYAANYRAILEEYRRQPQQGRLRDRTPLDVWNEALSRHPLRELPPELEYVLSTHKRLIPRVSEKGITIRLSRHESAVYWSGDLGKFVSKPALYFWNPDFPTCIFVSDTQRQNFIAVERKILPAMTAMPADLQKMRSEKRKFIANATGEFGNLTHPLKNTIIRDTDHREADKALGKFIPAEIENRKAEEKSRKSASTQRATAGSEMARKAAERLKSKTQLVEAP